MVRDEVKKLNWLTAVQLLVFGLLIPFRVLMMMAEAANSARKYEQEVNFLERFCENVGFGHWENTLVILIAGIFCALCVFSYLHSSVRLDFLHSLPIKRDRLFAVKYLSGTLTFVIAYVCSQVLALLIGAVYGCFSGTVALEMLAATAMGILYFLCSFSGTILAVMLTGKLLTAVCAIGVMGLYFPMIILLKYVMQVAFLENLFDDVYLGMESWLRYTSPWSFCMFHFEDGQHATGGMTGAWPNMGDVCQLIAVAAILTAVSVLLYRIRRTEAAGSALAFRKTEGIIKLMLTIPTALIAAVFAFEVFENPVWEVFFMFLFGGLGCMVMEFIYRWDIRQVLSGKRHMVLTLFVSAAIFFAFRYDMAGYNTFLPAKEELQSMSIKDPYTQFLYRQDGVREDNWDTQPTKEVMDYLETGDFDAIYKVAQNGVENTGEEYWEGYCVHIKYHLKNGREEYRSYHVDADVYTECMNELLKDEAFREKYFPILTWEGDNGSYDAGAYIPKSMLEADGAEAETEMSDEYYEDEYYYDEWYYENESVYVAIPSDRVEELIEAYCRDLENASYASVLNGEGNLFFSYEYTMEEYYPFDETFTETLKVLQDIRQAQ